MTWRSPCAVDGQQVDALAEVRDDLAADLEKVPKAEDVDPRLDDLLEALLGRQRRRLHLGHRFPVHPPQPKVHRHAAGCSHEPPEVLRRVAHRLASAAHGRRPLRQLTHARPTVLRRPHRARPDRLRLARRPPRRGAARPRAARPARRRSRDAASSRHVAVAEDRPAGLLRVPRFRAARAARMVRRTSRRARLRCAQAYSEDDDCLAPCAARTTEPLGCAAAQAEARAQRCGPVRWAKPRLVVLRWGRSALDSALLIDRLIVTGVQGQVY